MVGFRVVHVFDISQTDGEPLAEVRAAVLDGDLPAHWATVAELITSAGFSLEVADVDRLGEANGITDWRDRQVVVRQSLPGAQRFKTAVHVRVGLRSEWFSCLQNPAQQWSVSTQRPDGHHRPSQGSMRQPPP